MIHRIVLKFEKIWLSHTLKIIRKRNVWRTDGRTDTKIPICPRLSSSGGMKTAVPSFINVSNQTCCLYIYLLLQFDNFHKNKVSPPPGIGNFNVHLYFISSSYLIRGNVWVNKTRLTPSLFIEVFVPGQEMKRPLFLWFC